MTTEVDCLDVLDAPLLMGTIPWTKLVTQCDVPLRKQLFILDVACCTWPALSCPDPCLSQFHERLDVALSFLLLQLHTSSYECSMHSNTLPFLSICCETNCEVWLAHCINTQCSVVVVTDKKCDDCRHQKTVPLSLAWSSRQKILTRCMHAACIAHDEKTALHVFSFQDRNLTVSLGLIPQLRFPFSLFFVTRREGEHS